jgi:hypothetical protein
MSVDLSAPPVTYWMLWNDAYREGAKSNLGMITGFSCFVPLHKIWVWNPATSGYLK